MLALVRIFCRQKRIPFDEETGNLKISKISKNTNHFFENFSLENLIRFSSNLDKLLLLLSSKHFSFLNKFVTIK